MMGVLLREKSGQRETHTEGKPHAKMEAETGMPQMQARNAKQCQEAL